MKPKMAAYKVFLGLNDAYFLTGMLYCKPHYCKVRGIFGYGFGQGAGTFHYTK